MLSQGRAATLNVPSDAAYQANQLGISVPQLTSLLANSGGRFDLSGLFTIFQSMLSRLGSIDTKVTAPTGQTTV